MAEIGDMLQARRGQGQTFNDRPVRPTLFIGLGGTGVKVLARFRQRLFERYGSADFWPIYSFLAIDSDKPELEFGGKEGGIGVPVARDDRYPIALDSATVANMLNNLGTGAAYAHIGRWLPANRTLFRDMDLTKGAGQFRSAGRMLFCHHLAKVQNLIIQRCDRISDPQAVADARAKRASLPGDDGDKSNKMKVDVVLISSIAGGTGAGSFLDCAYLVRQMAIKSLIGIEQVRGMLVMPDAYYGAVNNSLEQVRIRANAYAALRELEYFSNPKNDFDTADWGVRAEAQERLLSQAPFDVCYLFSRSNGKPLGSPQQVYDLIADSLIFSAAGTPLASRMRSCWSNAQGQAYGGEMSAELKDPDAPVGQEAQVFERVWTTRFSSLGIASVTLKLPELRRIGGLRLLRRSVMQEIGTAHPNDSPAGVQEAQAAVRRVEEVRDLLQAKDVDVRGKIEQRISRVEGKAEPSAQTAADASRLVDATLRALDKIAQECQDASLATERDAQLLVANARDVAKKIAQAVYEQLRRTSPTNARERLAVVIEQLKRTAVTMAEGVDNGMAQVDACQGLIQWKDLDDAGIDDLLGLGYRAQQIVRGKTTTWFRQQADLRLNKIDVYLRRIYINDVANLLANLAQKVTQEITQLAGLYKSLGDLQQELVKNFAESRNRVLTAKLAAYDDPKAEKALDAQVDAALDRLLGTAEPGTRMRDAKARILEKLSERAGFPVSTMLQVRTDLEPRDSGTFDGLVDQAASLMTYLPANQDIFHAMQETGESITEAILPSVLDRARPYWPLLPLPKFEETISGYKLSGAVDLGTQHPPRQQALNFLTARGYQFYASGPNDPGSPLGELAIVHEAHGYSIPSLESLTSLHEAYEYHIQKGDVAHRHLNWRLRMSLPDLRVTTPQDWLDEVEACDAALFCILLGRFTWSEDRGCYRYSPDNVEQYDVGDTYEAAARWMRLPDGRPHRKRIGDWLNDWFQARIDFQQVDPNRQREEALRQAKLLRAIDLILELLGQHCFPSEKDIDGHQRRGPAHTMTRRMRRSQLKDNLDYLRGLVSPAEKSESWLRAEVAPRLHNFARFVGPGEDRMPPRTDPSVQAIRSRRLLQLCNVAAPDKPDYRGDPQQGRSTLDEAFKLYWFDERVRVRSDVIDLFPNDVKPRDPDIDMSNIGVTEVEKPSVSVRTFTGGDAGARSTTSSSPAQPAAMKEQL